MPRIFVLYPMAYATGYGTICRVYAMGYNIDICGMRGKAYLRGIRTQGSRRISG